MTKRRDSDPELENLLRAFREIHPSADEKERWRTAIAVELRESDAKIPDPRPIPRRSLVRAVARVAIPLAAAASLGFLVGATLVERRVEQGQTLLFGQAEPKAFDSRPPATMDDQREVIRDRFFSGEER